MKAATIERGHESVLEHISIHAAREGGDRVNMQLLAGRPHFNPRRP